MNIIVVGAGGTARELLRRLGDRWEVVLIDPDQSKLDTAAQIRPCTVVVGDGSSAVTLRKAGLDDADAMVAMSGDDDVNLEATRFAREAGVLRVIAVVSTPERAADFRELGAEVVSPDTIAARRVELQLEPRRVASNAFAEGKAEAIEFLVSPDSAVRDRPLKDFHSETWIVAAVLREGSLIVPHGDTVLLAGDRVTVVGAARDFAAIVRTFTAGESRFPLSFGRKVGVVLDSAEDLDGSVAEGLGLVRNSRAEELMVIHRDPATERDPRRAEELEELLAKLEARADGAAIDHKPSSPPLGRALVSLAGEESVGVLVVPAPGGGEVLGRRRVARVVNEYGSAGVPLLLARGRHPYASIVVPARRTLSGETAGRAGIDLARSSGASLVGVAVVSPTFMGQDDADDARTAAGWLREEAAVQDVPVRRHVKRGNPVRVMEEMAGADSLIVLAMPRLPMSVLRPRLSGHIIRRVSASVLLVPRRS
jgi:trk system potassium uptake protein TrkA